MISVACGGSRHPVIRVPYPTFCLTTANTDNRKPVPDLIEDLTGWLYGYKDYISEKLVAWLKEKGLNLVTKVRKNMKPKGLTASY